MRQLALIIEANRKKAQADAVRSRLDVARAIVDLFTGFGALGVGLLLAALAAIVEGKVPCL
ncbi:MAG: hypothetical protein R2909_20170 [Gemmatimonadales bacterium]